MPLFQTIQDTFGMLAEAVLVDGAYATGQNLASLQKMDVELLSPVGDAEDTAARNPALREDPTVPVTDEDVGKLPLNAQTKNVAKACFVHQ